MRTSILEHLAIASSITRVEVMQWEANGSPMGICPNCKHYSRLGLDRCVASNKPGRCK